MKELNMKNWLESEAYERQKEIIRKEVNNPIVVKKDHTVFAGIRIPEPARFNSADYSVFNLKLHKGERDKLESAKRNHKDEIKKYYGHVNGYLNIPSKSLTQKIVLSF